MSETQQSQRTTFPPEQKAWFRQHNINPEELEAMLNGESDNPELAIAELAVEEMDSRTDLQSSPGGTNSQESQTDHGLLKALCDI